MKFDDVRAIVGQTPHILPDQAALLYEHVLRTRPRRILELGFAHGSSTTYMAAALDEAGVDGRISTFDMTSAHGRQPSIHDLLGAAGLERFVTAKFSDSSYTWELLHMLQQRPQPRFDFVFVDGAHTWDVDGFAFFLADRLMSRGAWIAFDDMNWTLAKSPNMKNLDWVQALPDEQPRTPQIRRVFELLVRTHPGYSNFHEDDQFGWAQKKWSMKARQRLRSHARRAKHQLRRSSAGGASRAMISQAPGVVEPR